jgi:NADH dehydrogenase FAD-containing subunit
MLRSERAAPDFLLSRAVALRESQPQMLRVVLLHRGRAILPELGDRLRAYGRKKLARR